MFTLENVFDKRVEFENAWKGANACKDEFSKLLKAETKSDFMEVIYDNFEWVYREVTRFGFTYDYVSNFKEGFARVQIRSKWGFVNSKGEEICEIKYNYVGHFDDGFASVRNGSKWGFINSKGKEVYEVK